MDAIQPVVFYKTELVKKVQLKIPMTHENQIEFYLVESIIE